MSETLRAKTWRPDSRELLVARIADSDQEADLTEPTNCGGVGRLRHFRSQTSDSWPTNPLPIDPAQRFLGGGLGQGIVAQVFQNLACNWRCWYCYVPFNLLNGNPSRGEFLTAEELVLRFINQPSQPAIIDISGGQPDLIPEWTLDTLRAIERHCPETYVWSDDNLSTDYLWQYLSSDEISWMADQENHGRVGCFKGFDASSFSYNTRASPELFSQQFELFDRLRIEGFDLYGYITLTTPDAANVKAGVRDCLDRLQEIHVNTPLRVIPLEVSVFGPVESRLDDMSRSALENQQRAIEAWTSELEDRFDESIRTTPICDVSISN